MSWDARCLRLAERITGRACRCLPDGERNEWYRVWVAELPQFLDDADGGPLPLRAARMLWCSGDHHRAARRIAAIARPRRRFWVPSQIVLVEVVRGVLAVLSVVCFFALMAAGGLSNAAEAEGTGYSGGGCLYVACEGDKFTPDPKLSHLEGHLAWLIAQNALLALLVISVGWLLLCVFRSRRRRVAAPEADG